MLKTCFFSCFPNGCVLEILSLFHCPRWNLNANFREIPAICQPVADEVIDDLTKAGFKGLYMNGYTSEPVCEMPVELNKVGIVLLGGLNPVASAEEAGIDTDNIAMSTVMDYDELVQFREAAIDFRDLRRFWESSR